MGKEMQLCKEEDTVIETLSNARNVLSFLSRHHSLYISSPDCLHGLCSMERSVEILVKLKLRVKLEVKY